METLTPQAAFVTRLRRYRLKSGISLDEIVAETRVRREHFDAFERNDLTRWPRGLYARAWVRAYASAVGLDPIDTVNEFCRLFPHGDRRLRPTLEQMAWIVAAVPAWEDDFPLDRRQRAESTRDAGMPAVGARTQGRAATGAVGFLTRTLLGRFRHSWPPARQENARPADR